MSKNDGDTVVERMMKAHQEAYDRATEAGRGQVEALIDGRLAAKLISDTMLAQEGDDV